jgi:hypothetical protein
VRYLFCLHTIGRLETSNTPDFEVGSDLHVRDRLSVWKETPDPVMDWHADFGDSKRTIVTSILRLATIWPLVTSPDTSYKLALARVFMCALINGSSGGGFLDEQLMGNVYIWQQPRSQFCHSMWFAALPPPVSSPLCLRTVFLSLDHQIFEIYS